MDELLFSEADLFGGGLGFVFLFLLFVFVAVFALFFVCHFELLSNGSTR